MGNLCENLGQQSFESMGVVFKAQRDQLGPQSCFIVDCVGCART